MNIYDQYVYQILYKHEYCKVIFVYFFYRLELCITDNLPYCCDIAQYPIYTIKLIDSLFVFGQVDILYPPIEAN